jgi:RNA 3'-terminal phosphate cyclase (ATP)
VPRSPSFDFLARHWTSLVSRLGFEVATGLKRAGFYPPGGGEVWSQVRPWSRPASALRLEERGPLRHLRGISGAGRLKHDVAKRQRDAAQSFLWEQRRIEVDWEVLDVPASSPGSFILIEAIFEQGRCATSRLGERRLSAELVGERAARSFLGLLEAEGAVDAHLADQLAVPLALSGRGGRVSTIEVTSHLETVVEVLRAFGFAARTWGRRGGRGGLEVEAVDRQDAGD